VDFLGYSTCVEVIGMSLRQSGRASRRQILIGFTIFSRLLKRGFWRRYELHIYSYDFYFAELPQGRGGGTPQGVP
jgi:hypothetical protein